MREFYDMSRSDKRDDAIESAANKGEYSVTLKLFSSEVKRLRNKGFKVIRIGENSENRKNQLPSKVSWYFEDTFVSFSQIGNTDLLGYIMEKVGDDAPPMPEGLTNAQKQCLIASRVRYWRDSNN